MDDRVKAAIEECTDGSDEERLTFPQVVMTLMAAGVEQYHADFRRSEKTYYLSDGDSHVTPSRPVAGKIAETFQPQAVEAAVRAIQAQRITYAAFCERCVAAGCVGYFVCLAGRRAIYFGRTGDNYVEPFPPAPK